MLSTGQQENSQACKTLIKESQYVLTCLTKAMLQFLISRAPVTHLILGQAPVTTAGEWWRAQAAIPLCCCWSLVGAFLWWTEGCNPVCGIVFPDWFMLCLAAVSMSTGDGADLPNILCHYLCSFSAPSFFYLTENWVGNISNDKLFSGRIPFSWSVQHPLPFVLFYPVSMDPSLTLTEHIPTAERRWTPWKMNFLF